MFVPRWPWNLIVNSLRVEQTLSEHATRVRVHSRANEATATLASNGVTYEVQSNAALESVAFTQQADSSLNTLQAFELRQANRREGQVREALHAWWMVALRTEQQSERGATNISKALYLAVYQGIYQALLDESEYDADEAARSVEEDWHADMKISAVAHAGRMERAQFLDSLFEIADTWTSSLQPEDYADFLFSLLGQLVVQGTPPLYHDGLFLHHRPHHVDTPRSPTSEPPITDTLDAGLESDNDDGNSYNLWPVPSALRVAGDAVLAARTVKLKLPAPPPEVRQAIRQQHSERKAIVQVQSHVRRCVCNDKVGVPRAQAGQPKVAPPDEEAPPPRQPAPPQPAMMLAPPAQSAPQSVTALPPAQPTPQSVAVPPPAQSASQPTAVPPPAQPVPRSPERSAKSPRAHGSTAIHLSVSDGQEIIHMADHAIRARAAQHHAASPTKGNGAHTSAHEGLRPLRMAHELPARAQRELQTAAHETDEQDVPREHSEPRGSCTTSRSTHRQASSSLCASTSCHAMRNDDLDDGDRHQATHHSQAPTSARNPASVPPSPSMPRHIALQRTESAVTLSHRPQSPPPPPAVIPVKPLPVWRGSSVPLNDRHMQPGTSVCPGSSAYNHTHSDSAARLRHRCDSCLHGAWPSHHCVRIAVETRRHCGAARDGL